MDGSGVTLLKRSVHQILSVEQQYHNDQGLVILSKDLHKNCLAIDNYKFKQIIG